MSPGSIDLYSNLGDGQCSLMGFEWANLDTMIAKMKWATNKVTNENYVRAIIKEFQNLGKAAIARAGPACNLEKAGVVDCNLLFFPHKYVSEPYFAPKLVSISEIFLDLIYY